MKRTIQVYFKPISVEIELPNDLDERDVEQKLNEIVYEKRVSEIIDQAEIDYFE